MGEFLFYFSSIIASCLLIAIGVYVHRNDRFMDKVIENNLKELNQWQQTNDTLSTHLSYLEYVELRVETLAGQLEQLTYRIKQLEQWRQINGKVKMFDFDMEQDHEKPN